MEAPIRLFLCHLICVIAVVGGFHATADQARGQHEIFDERLIQKWKDYEAFAHSLQGSARVERIINGKPQESILRFKQNRECALAIFPHNRDSSLLLCTLGNPNYIATLDLSKTDPSNAVLHNFTPLPGDTGTVSPFEFVFKETSRHFSYGVKPLRQAISDPSFKVIKVTKETQNGQELVRVDHTYNYVRQASNEDVHEWRHGSLWLDPSRCWCIRRSKQGEIISASPIVGGSLISSREQAYDSPR